MPRGPLRRFEPVADACQCFGEGGELGWSGWPGVPDDRVVIGCGVLADVPVAQAVFTVNGRRDSGEERDDVAAVFPTSEDDPVRGFAAEVGHGMPSCR